MQEISVSGEIMNFKIFFYCGGVLIVVKLEKTGVICVFFLQWRQIYSILIYVKIPLLQWRQVPSNWINIIIVGYEWPPSENPSSQKLYLKKKEERTFVLSVHILQNWPKCLKPLFIMNRHYFPTADIVWKRAQGVSRRRVSSPALTARGKEPPCR